MSKEIRKEKIGELCEKIKYEVDFCNGLITSLAFVSFTKTHERELKKSIENIRKYTEELEKYK